MEYKHYLNIFSSQSDYESQKDEVMDMPHVVLLEDTNEVIFASKNKEIDYALEFFTIEALEEGEVSFTFGTGESCAETLSYSLDNGKTWSELQRESPTPTLQKGDKIQFKTVFNEEDSSVCTFQTTMPFNVEGNIMSLLYGDDFKGKNELTSRCFGLCFEDSSIVSAKNLILPATTLADFCYISMFIDCTNLTTAPELPATTLAYSCYKTMFYGCTSLTEAPELPATTLAENCYESMFIDCTNLTTAPELPATTLKNSCYYSMFYGCTSLTEAPQLPATTLAEYCYYGMFYGCTSLTEAPELPATTLANGCYSNMFANCTSLTTAPELLATPLADFCYITMFKGCSKLNYIKMLATDISANLCLYNWVTDVASSGTFVKNAAMKSLPNGYSGIPNGWTVEEYDEIDYASQPFTLVALEDGTMDIALPSGVTFMNYSLNDGDWVENTEDIALEVKANDKVKLKANAQAVIGNDYKIFDLSMPFNAEGNIMSLLYGDDFKDKKTIENEQCFYYCFYETKIVSAKNLILPATILAYECYYGMFKGCTSLITAPELPATTLATDCYSYMFSNCTNLVEAPELLSTELAEYCYRNMFYNCTNLTTAPALPATTLEYRCYENMFYKCSSLTKITMLATDISASYCLYDWVNGVASSGTFVKNPNMATLPTATPSNIYQGIPKGWTVQNY